MLVFAQFSFILFVTGTGECDSNLGIFTAEKDKTIRDAHKNEMDLLLAIIEVKHSSS